MTEPRGIDTARSELLRRARQLLAGAVEAGTAAGANRSWLEQAALLVDDIDASLHAPSPSRPIPSRPIRRDGTQ